MTTTANDICLQALRKAGIVGVGQPALAEDINDAFTDLNDMLALWQRKRWMIWHLIDLALTSTGAQKYSVGPGGDFNIARPDRLEDAFFRQTIQSQPNQIDYPLIIIEARETYDQIALKQLTSFPSYIFYDSAFPLGYVYPWPVPQASIYEIHIVLKAVLASFTSLGATVNLPPEYIPALKWSLAEILRASYQLPPDIAVIAQAKNARNVIRNANTQIPKLTMPNDLIRPGIYNPYSDQIR